MRAKSQLGRQELGIIRRKTVRHLNGYGAGELNGDINGGHGFPPHVLNLEPIGGKVQKFLGFHVLDQFFGFIFALGLNRDRRPEGVG